jgi:hypothetical protein
MDESRHEAADGTLYAVGREPAPHDDGAASTRLLVRASRDGGRSWSLLPLRACPAHLHRAGASDWPPPAELAAGFVDGRLAIEFDNVYDPWAKAQPTTLQAHARWQATYDPRWRWWTLHQLRLHSADEPATR